jgi:SAM-dependent methyltransferase
MSLWNVDDYVRLRHGGDDEALGLFAERHVARGAQVLEVGCGPGRAAAALDRRHGARVTAVDASADMLTAARELTPPSVELVEARAEALPFADSAFDAALSNFAVHLFDRPRAFAEIRRVLRQGSPYWVKTANPDRFDDHWAARFFPSFVDIEVARFPGETELRAQLEGAGFAVVVERLEGMDELSREAALERLSSGWISTLALLPPGEREAGIALARETLDDPVRFPSTLLLVTATA